MAGCAQNSAILGSSQQSNKGFAKLQIKTIGNTTIETFDSIGYTAMEMLRKNHKVELSYWESVKCIDDVCASSRYWWPMSVNGKKSSIGPRSYVVRNNDVVEFALSTE